MNQPKSTLCRKLVRKFIEEDFGDFDYNLLPNCFSNKNVWPLFQRKWFIYLIIFSSEYVYNSPKLNETRKIVENTLLEYEQKHGFNYHRSVKVKCVAEFLNKIKNETKNKTIERYNIIGELKKVMQSSKGMIKLIRIIELKIIVKGRICKNVLDPFLKCEIYPVLWKKILLKILNDRPKTFIQHCREKHFCNFKDCRIINWTICLLVRRS